MLRVNALNLRFFCVVGATGIPEDSSGGAEKKKKKTKIKAIIKRKGFLYFNRLLLLLFS
jgi:hypothetical protein